VWSPSDVWELNHKLRGPQSTIATSGMMMKVQFLFGN